MGYLGMEEDEQENEKESDEDDKLEQRMRNLVFIDGAVFLSS